MTRRFLDDDLLTWEAYATGGKYGLPDDPKVIFHCLNDGGRRARFIQFEGDNADAARLVREATDAELLDLLDESSELDRKVRPDARSAPRPARCRPGTARQTAPARPPSAVRRK